MPTNLIYDSQRVMHTDISQDADTFHYFDRLSMGSLFVRLVPLLLRLSLLVVLPT